MAIAIANMKRGMDNSFASDFQKIVPQSSEPIEGIAFQHRNVIGKPEPTRRRSRGFQPAAAHFFSRSGRRTRSTIGRPKEGSSRRENALCSGAAGRPAPAGRRFALASPAPERE
jgi:hypothetical protein